MIEVKVCENNFVHGTEDVVNRLKQNKNFTVDVQPCLGYCGDCANGPYALVNDELVQADSAAELYEAIVKFSK